MAKKTCPNGHIYDSAIYGDQCPLCPRDGVVDSNSHSSYPPPYTPGDGGGTMIESPQVLNSPRTGGGSISQSAPEPDPTGRTILPVQNSQNLGNAHQQGGRTVIRSPKGVPNRPGRKLVGFLVTYNRYPLGKSFEIYEGKNYVGRDGSCDISVDGDDQISGTHMMILYRGVDNRFRIFDEKSTNGTFVNKMVTDEGDLQNYDIIRIGNTVFLFIAIPQF